VSPYWSLSWQSCSAGIQPCSPVYRSNGTNSLEQSLIEKINPQKAGAPGGSMMAMSNSTMAMSNTKADRACHDDVCGKGAGNLPVEGEIPSFAGATLWLNSPPLTARRACEAKSSWSIFGPIPASTVCAPALRGIVVPEIKGSRLGGDRRARAGIRI